MSSLDRRTLLLALPLMAAACGFTPVYGPGGIGNALYGQIAIQAPEDILSDNETDAYLLVRNLEDRLGRPQSTTYTLDLSISTRSEGQAITLDNEITRYSIVGTVGFTLTRVADGAIAASGTVAGFTGYSATGSTVETLAGENDAHERLMMMLADQLNARILATADLSATPAAATPAG